MADQPTLLDVLPPVTDAGRPRIRPTRRDLDAIALDPQTSGAPSRWTHPVSHSDRDIELIHGWLRTGMPENESTRAYAANLLGRLLWELADLYGAVDALIDNTREGT